MPWMQSDATFASAGAAYDEVMGLRAPITDCVVRVQREDVLDNGERRVRPVRDWLWDLREEGPVIIPWHKTEKSWTDKASWVEAWDSCLYPTWLAGEALAFGRSDLAVLGACGCLRAALYLLEGDEGNTAPDDVLRVITALEQWSAGIASANDVRRCRDALADTEYEDFDANYVVMAARELASNEIFPALEDIARARGLYDEEEDDFDDPERIMTADFKKSVTTLAFLRGAAGLPR